MKEFEKSIKTLPYFNYFKPPNFQPPEKIVLNDNGLYLIN